MMGDAADDMFDHEERMAETANDMRRAGCRPCPTCKGAAADVLTLLTDCPTCGDTGWLDANGTPCEAG